MGLQNLVIHQGTTDASPETVGFNPAKLDQLDTFFMDLIRHKKLQAASYLLSRNGKVFASKSMGPLTFREGSPDLMPDSIRRLASITKSVTAIAVMKLVEDGKIYLNQPVMTLIEEFNTPMHRDIQIIHLLTHASGLKAIPGYFLEPYPGERPDIQPGDNWITKALEGPLQAEIGTAWIYSNWNYILLGEIITRVSGMSYVDYMNENIIKPLGMERTYFKVPPKFMNQVCMIYEWEEEDYPVTFDAPAGGLFSTLYDLWKLGQMMLNHGRSIDGFQILGRKTVELMTRNHLTGIPAFYWGGKIKDFSYGLGWYLIPKELNLESPGTFSNEGWGRTAFYIDPVEQMIAVYFVPSTIDWFPEQLVNPRAIMWSGLK